MPLLRFLLSAPPLFTSPSLPAFIRQKRAFFIFFYLSRIPFYPDPDSNNEDRRNRTSPRLPPEVGKSRGTKDGRKTRANVSQSRPRMDENIVAINDTYRRIASRLITRHEITILRSGIFRRCLIPCIRIGLNIDRLYPCGG